MAQFKEGIFLLNLTGEQKLQAFGIHAQLLRNKENVVEQVLSRMVGVGVVEQQFLISNGHAAQSFAAQVEKEMGMLAVLIGVQQVGQNLEKIQKTNQIFSFLVGTSYQF